MKPLVKSAVESALIALLVAGCCLWFLISNGTADEVNNAKMTLLALSLAASLIAHLTYMGLALKRDGRPLLRWMLGLVLLFPIVTVVALVLMSARDEESQSAV
jgi:uncharacterized membrane protein YhhN